MAIPCYLRPVLAVLLVGGLATLASAQELPKADQFFGKDFMQEAPAASPQEQSTTTEAATPSASATPTDTSGKIDPMHEGDPVLAASIYVDGRKEENVISALRAITLLADSKKIGIYRVGGIGYQHRENSQFSPRIPALMMAISTFGGRFDATETMPLKYLRASRAPVWILHTSTGDVVLEGFESVDSFISNQGKFVSP